MMSCSNSKYSSDSDDPKVDSNAPCCVEENYERKDTIRVLDCIAINFKCSLRVCESETVLQLSYRLGKLMKCSSSELVLICNGIFISRHPLFSLDALGIFASSSTCKLVISQRPPGPTWLHVTTIFLCSSSLLPLLFRMLAESTICTVKERVRELLRCPVAVFSLHLPDGSTLPDSVTLRDLGVADGDRLYCRIRSEEQEPMLPSALATAAAAVRKLVQQAENVASGRTGRKRLREDDMKDADETTTRNDSGRGDEALLDMPRGVEPAMQRWHTTAAAGARQPPPAAHVEAAIADREPQPPS